MRLKKIAALALTGVIMAGVALTGCGSIDPEATVATVNSIPIGLGLANFAAQYTAVGYDTYYMSYFGQDMWSSDPSGNGKTMTDSVKSNTLDKLKEYYLLEQHMADYGVVLTDEELKKAEAAAAQFIADNTDEAIRAMGATEDVVKEFLRLNLLQKKMYDAIVADVDTNVPDEECAQKTFSYVRVSKTASADSEGDSDEAVEKSDEQKAAEAKEKAQKILDAALLGSQKDPLEAAAKDNDANKATCSYGAADLNEEDNSTYLEPEVLEEAEKLGEGEFAKNPVETDNGFYIIRMDRLFDQEATDEERESIIADRESDLYDDILDGYKASADWTIDEKVWETVNFDTIYSKATQANTTEQTDTNAVVEE